MNKSSSPIGFVAPDPSELARLLPVYGIHDLIATGGMGAVYRAVEKSLDRTVALKILPMEFSEDAEFCAGFEAEAKAMARLNHPNLSRHEKAQALRCPDPLPRKRRAQIPSQRCAGGQQSHSWRNPPISRTEELDRQTAQ